MSKKEKIKNSKKARNTFFALSAGTALLLTGGLMSACDGNTGVQVTNVAFYSGTENPTAETGRVGDFYFETDTCNLWLRNENGWEVVSCLKGEKGDKGDAGQNGTDGRAGTDGRDGKNAFQIAKDLGLTTAQTQEDWILELQGQTKGKDGTQIYSGTTNPTQETVGAIGDFYLNETTGEFYKLTETGWVLKSTLKGINGQDGQDGRGIVSVEKTSTDGLIDTYTVTYTDNTTSTFTITNGADGEQGTSGQAGVGIADFNIEINQVGLLYSVTYTDEAVDRFLIAENGEIYKLKRGTEITTDTTTVPGMEIVIITTADDEEVSLITVGEYGVARYYEIETAEALQTALNNGASFVNLTQNIEAEETFVVSHSLMLNLNGNTITNATDKTFNITAGSVMISDEVGTGAISATGSLKDAITIANGANSMVMVNGATISATNRAINCIDSETQIMLNDANITGGAAAGIQTFGAIEVNGGTISGTGSSANGVQLSGHGSITVDGATISGTKYGIMGSTAERIAVNDGTISGTQGGISSGVETLIIRDATISSSTASAISITAGNVNILAGTFTGKNAVEINGTNARNVATVVIEGGTFTGTENAVLFKSANTLNSLTIMGGTFTGEINGISNQGGIISVNDATITGTTNYGITNFNRKSSKTEPFVVGTITIADSVVTGGTDIVYNPTAEYYQSGTLKTDGDDASVANPGGVVTFELADIDALTAFRDSVNAGSTYKGATVLLMNDVDLNNEEFTPIGYGCCNNGSVYDDMTGPKFMGTFDGQNHTISSLKITTFNLGGEGALDASAGVGLFGQVVCATIQNLKIDGAQVQGNHWVGALAGFVSHSTINNCSVSNADVSCVFNNEDDSGDKAGALIGYISGDYTDRYQASAVTNCSATGSTVNADRDAGQVIGCTWEIVDTTGTTATDVTVSGNNTNSDTTKSGQNINNTVVGRIAGV